MREQPPMMNQGREKRNAKTGGWIGARTGRDEDAVERWVVWDACCTIEASNGLGLGFVFGVVSQNHRITVTWRLWS